jgi:hypothetical protein
MRAPSSRCRECRGVFRRSAVVSTLQSPSRVRVQPRTGQSSSVERFQTAPSVLLPEIVIPSADAESAILQSPSGPLVLLPESFRGGCSFGTGANRFLPTGWWYLGRIAPGRQGGRPGAVGDNCSHRGGACDADTVLICIQDSFMPLRQRKYQWYGHGDPHKRNTKLPNCILDVLPKIGVAPWQAI